ncbi:MAG: phosphodiester glycosidase family protein [Limisphaerales bacterium]
MFGSSWACLAADSPVTGLAHGFSYQHEEIPDKPWSIHIIEVDRSNRDLELQTTLGGGDRFGLATLSRQVRTLPPELGRPVAAINGDYFYGGFGGFYRRRYAYLGDPKGLQILRGELVSGPADWTCFWVDPAGKPHMTNVASHFQVTWPNGERIPFELNKALTAGTAVLFTAVIGTSTGTSGGRELVLERDGTNRWLPLQAGETYSARVRAVREAGDTPLDKDTMVLSLGRSVSERAEKVLPGTRLRISTATGPDLKGVRTAIGGGPPIVRDGKVLDHLDAYVRNPRAAIGWNREHYFLVEVDGRQYNLSVGMTDPELAAYMVKLGCEEAMSLDGGGSATCWVYGQVMNSPSEGRERPMANALVLVHKETK